MSAGPATVSATVLPVQQIEKNNMPTNRKEREKKSYNNGIKRKKTNY